MSIYDPMEILWERAIPLKDIEGYEDLVDEMHQKEERK